MKRKRRVVLPLWTKAFFICCGMVLAYLTGSYHQQMRDLEYAAQQRAERRELEVNINDMHDLMLYRTAERNITQDRLLSGKSGLPTDAEVEAHYLVLRRNSQSSE